jgi:hypothetical protein
MRLMCLVVILLTTRFIINLHGKLRVSYTNQTNQVTGVTKSKSFHGTDNISATLLKRSGSFPSLNSNELKNLQNTPVSFKSEIKKILDLSTSKKISSNNQEIPKETVEILHDFDISVQKITGKNTGKNEISDKNLSTHSEEETEESESETEIPDDIFDENIKGLRDKQEKNIPLKTESKSNVEQIEEIKPKKIERNSWNKPEEIEKVEEEPEIKFSEKINISDTPFEVNNFKSSEPEEKEGPLIIFEETYPHGPDNPVRKLILGPDTEQNIQEPDTKKSIELTEKIELKPEIQPKIIETDPRKFFGIKEKIIQSTSKDGDLIVPENITKSDNPPLKSISSKDFTINGTTFKAGTIFLSYEKENKKYVQKMDPDPNNIYNKIFSPPLEVTDNKIKISVLDGEKFKKIGGELFSQEISQNDIKQVGLGDCFILGPLSAMAKYDPNHIKGMIKDNGETVTVKLYEKVDGKAVPKFITFDKSLNASGELNKNKPWVSMVEKAYAIHLGSYEKLGCGGFAKDALFTFYGKDALYSDIKPKTTGEVINASFVQTIKIDDTNINKIKNFMNSGIQQGINFKFGKAEELQLDAFKGKITDKAQINNFLLTTCNVHQNNINYLMSTNFAVDLNQNLVKYDECVKSLLDFPPALPKKFENKSLNELKQAVKDKVKELTGKEPSDIKLSQLDNLISKPHSFPLNQFLPTPKVRPFDKQVVVNMVKGFGLNDNQASDLVDNKIIIPHIKTKFLSKTDTTQDDFNNMVKHIKDKNKNDEHIVYFMDKMSENGNDKFKELKIGKIIKPGEKLEIKYKSEELRVFNSIKDAFNSGKLVTVDTGYVEHTGGDLGYSGNESKKLGIAGPHSYSVTGIVEMNGFKYIKVNNPWNSDFSRSYTMENGILKAKENNPNDYKYNKIVPKNLKNEILVNSQESKTENLKTYSKESNKINKKQNEFLIDNKLPEEKIKDNECWLELNDFTNDFTRFNILEK